MDSRQLLERAIHAARTGQPNLATLYMRRARQVLAAEIREQRRQRGALSFTQALIVARLNVADAARPFVEFLDAFNRATQADYALVAGPTTTARSTTP